MEGPSLKLAAEQLQPFKNKKVLEVSGNSKIGIERFLDKGVLDVFSWGKHLVFQFDDFALRVHFLLWGTFQAKVNGKSVTGDYEKKGTPRLVLTFENGQINFFNGSLKFIEEKDAKKSYNFSIDIMSPQFDKNQALKLIKKCPSEMITDILLDQEIFAGVGNIIKNEVLFIQKINPLTKVSQLSDQELKNLISETQDFSEKFYQWRKKFELKKHYQIYRKSLCPNCSEKLVIGNLGKRQRRTYYCPNCQSYLAEESS